MYTEIFVSGFPYAATASARLSVCLINVQPHEDIWWSGSIIAGIINLGTGW
jgi:hypothetical protein